MRATDGYPKDRTTGPLPQSLQRRREEIPAAPRHCARRQGQWTDRALGARDHEDRQAEERRRRVELEAPLAADGEADGLANVAGGGVLVLGLRAVADRTDIVVAVEEPLLDDRERFWRQVEKFLVV